MSLIIYALLALGAGAAPPASARNSILEEIARTKTHESSEDLRAALGPERLDDTLWRWAMTDEQPELRAWATQLLGATTYSPARFSRLISEMERAISVDDPRAFDLMVAVADMRAGSAEAAAQMKARVARGLPLSARAHYFRARVEYDLIPPGREVQVITAEMLGPSPAARQLAFRDAFRHAKATELGAPAELIDAMDLFLMLAPEATLLSSLELLRQRPHGFGALIPSLIKLYVNYPDASVRKMVGRTLFYVRGGGPSYAPGWQMDRLRMNVGPWVDGAKDYLTLICDRLLNAR